MAQPGDLDLSYIDVSSPVDAQVQAAIDDAYNDGGGVVVLPTGTLSLSAALILRNGVEMRGQGIAATKLRMTAGANDDAIRTEGFDTLTGTNTWLTEDGVVYGFAVRDLSIDGNKAANSSGYGLRIYGKGYLVDNVIIRDCASDGFFSEAGSETGQSDWTDLPESTIRRLWCRNNSGVGFRFRGPHNARIGQLVSCYNGGWGAMFETDGSATYDGNVSEAWCIHTYANGADKGVYMGAVVSVTRLITDGDNLKVDASNCTISRYKALNGGGARDCVEVTAAANQVSFGTLEISAAAPSGAASRTLLKVAGDRFQAGVVKILGNQHSNDGVTVTGNQAGIADLIVRECNQTGNVGLDLAGSDHRITGFVNNCTTGFNYTQGARNRVALSVTNCSTQTAGDSAVATDTIDIK